MLGGGARQPGVDDPASAVPPVIADTSSGAPSRAPSSVGLQRHVGEVALGQRAVAQAQALEAGAARVRDVGAGGDAQVVGLAADRGHRAAASREGHAQVAQDQVVHAGGGELAVLAAGPPRA